MQGAFTGGGSNQGVVRDNQDRFELENYTTSAMGTHSLNFGGRLASPATPTTPTPASTEITFTVHLPRRPPPPAPITPTIASSPPVRHHHRQPELEGECTSTPASSFRTTTSCDPKFTLSYGPVTKSQACIADHNDWAPRVSLAWALGKGNAPAKTVLRAGYGWFFDRSNSTNYPRCHPPENGVNQQQYVIKNPDFSQNAPPAGTLAALAVCSTIYSVSPHLRASLNMQAAVGIEHAFGKIATSSFTYINSRGTHQYLSDNINAFFPATYDAVTGTGSRPNGINQNIYQFESGGMYNQNQLVMNYSIRAKRVSLFGFTWSTSPRPILPAPPISPLTSSTPPPITAAPASISATASSWPATCRRPTAFPSAP